MFLTYLKSRQRVASRENVSVVDLLKQFNVAVIIVTSSLFFLVIPTAVFSGYVVLARRMPSEGVRVYVGVSLCVSDSIDGIVYIFIYEPVRKLLKEKGRNFMRCVFVDVNKIIKTQILEYESEKCKTFILDFLIIFINLKYIDSVILLPNFKRVGKMK